jgi:hypothetical protein
VRVALLPATIKAIVANRAEARSETTTSVIVRFRSVL